MLNPFSDAFGLDIGDRTFKLVQMRHKRGQAGYRIAAWGSVDVPEGVMERGEIQNMDAAVSCLTRLVRSASGKLSGRSAVACLPEAKTFVKVINAVGADDAALRQAVVAELEQSIPLPIEDIYFDWQKLDAHPAPATATPGTDDAAPRTRIMLGAAPRQLVEDYTTMLERAGLAPIALEIEATAISRAIIPEGVAAAGAVGILDIGGTRSSLVISDEGVLQMSISIPISGIGITTAVSESLNISMEDAEKLKRECGLDANRCEDKMWKILQPLIEDMTEKVRNALRFYQIGFPDGKKIERIYLCGGGGQFHEIDTVLSRKLTIQVRRGDALANVDKRLPAGFSADGSLQYATAIGLGIRAAKERDALHG